MIELLFCSECGNRIRKFIKGKIIRGEFREVENGEIFGICINEHMNRLDPSEAIERYTVRREKNFKETIIIKDKNELKDKIAISISCPHCGGGKGKLLYSYTSHGDEENTNIIRCLSCGKNFRSGFWG